MIEIEKSSNRRITGVITGHCIVRSWETWPTVPIKNAMMSRNWYNLESLCTTMANKCVMRLRLEMPKLASS